MEARGYPLAARCKMLDICGWGLPPGFKQPVAGADAEYMEAMRHPRDPQHPQLRGVTLAPGSQPISRRSWDRDSADSDFSAAARLSRARRKLQRLI